MKKIATIIATMICSVAAIAQTLNIEFGKVTYMVPASQAGEMIYSDATTLTVMNKVFKLSDITRMYVSNATVTDSEVNVIYNGDEAIVLVPGNIMQYLDVTASGATVSITQDESLAEEISYIVSGSSTNGSFTMDGDYKAKVTLSNLTLTNTTGAPIDIKNGKRIALVLEGTNTLTDAAASTRKGCLYVNGHTEIDGSGTLNINAYGSKAHGLYSGEYIQLKKGFKGSINIGTTTKDGIHCSQYFQMNAGNITITNPGDDGIQVEASAEEGYDEDVPDGDCVIKGGNIDITIANADVKGIRCDSTLTVTSKFSTPVIKITGTSTAYAAKGIKANYMDLQAGTFTINLAGKGIWDEEDLETSACSALKAVDMNISGGTYTFTATGAGGKGVSCDNSFIFSDGDMTVTTSGGCYVYLNGTEYTNYTSNLDNIDTANKSSSKGIKVGESTTVSGKTVKTGSVVISDGKITVTTSTNGAEGIECKGTVDISGGEVTVTAYDDAINSGLTMTITGGTVTVSGSNNDGLDSNGDLWIKGGTIIAYGSTAPECGIDANEEENYHVYFTGGTVLAIGGGNSVPKNSNSTQAYVSTSTTVTAGTQITLTSGTTTLASFTATRSYTSGGGGGGRPGPGPGGQGATVLISCPDLAAGSSYTLTSGTSSSNVTAKRY